jgi:hypothetical protein
MVQGTDTREVKHKSTVSPYECPHCGYIWYGYPSNPPSLPDADLCHPCWRALEHYLLKHHYKEFNDDADTIPGYASDWVQDKSQKPLPRSEDKRFHKSSVPAYMRSAITQGLVKPNDKLVYVVYSQGMTATRVEVVERGIR